MQSTFTHFAKQSQDAVLLLARVVVGYVYLLHGTTKLFAMPTVMAGDKGTVDLFSMMGLGGVLETVGGILLILGLFTRVNAFIQAGMMAVAYFYFHVLSNDIGTILLPAVNKGEAAVLFCMVFLLFWVMGAGKLSLDEKLLKTDN